MKCGGGCPQRDLLGGWWAFVLWCLPTASVLLGAALPHLRAALWIPSFAVMGVACLVNARGCGRMHCFVTGPLFLIASIATALDALAIVSIGWVTVLVGTAMGTLVAYSLERLRGKYVGTSVT